MKKGECLDGGENGEGVGVVGGGGSPNKSEVTFSEVLHSQ